MASRRASKEISPETVGSSTGGGALVTPPAATAADRTATLVLAAAAALYILRCLPTMLFPSGLTSLLTLAIGFALGVMAAVSVIVSKWTGGRADGHSDASLLYC